MKYSIFSFSCRTLLLALLLLLTGCGKKSMPLPDDRRDQFAWTSSSAQITLNGCLSVYGTLSGNVAKLTDVIFELQPLAADDTCDNCPFTPAERAEFPANTLRGHPEVNTVRLTYCPREQAPFYRWRMVGINIHRRFPYALTPIHKTETKEEKETYYAPFLIP